MAPNVMSSPCEKFVSLVVPKISERPRAASPMIRPNLMPPTRAVMNFSANGTCSTAATPIWNCTKLPPSRRALTVRVVVPSNSTSSGSVVSSSSTVYSPRSGIEMNARPSSLVTPSPTSSPSAEVTLSVTPGTGVGGLVELSTKVTPTYAPGGGVSTGAGVEADGVAGVGLGSSVALAAVAGRRSTMRASTAVTSTWVVRRTRVSWGLEGLEWRSSCWEHSPTRGRRCGSRERCR